VAGRDADGHSGGISRFQERARELVLAVSRGEAPPPTRYRGVGRAREAIWVKVIVDEHVAPGIKVRQNSAKVDLAALA
jgi:hypothetical protein